ncbi:MAG: type II secretion system F family protein [Thermoplasmatota archaeon]
MAEGAGPRKARKQIVEGKGSSKDASKGLKLKGGSETRNRNIVIGISAVFTIIFVVLGAVTFPSQVKDELKDDYDRLSDSDKRIGMKEGLVDANLTFYINTSVGGTNLTKRVNIGWYSYFTLAYISATGPISFYMVRKKKRIDKVEERLSDFLRDVSESMRAGQTLHEAIKTSAGGEYGDLTAEIKKMSMQVSWGVSAYKAMIMFSERVNTPLVKRAVTLINEASSAGGNVSNVIEAAAKDTRELQIMKKTRATEMAMYKYVIGISFMVFLVVIGIMFGTFMPTMEKQAESYSDSGSTSQTPGGFDPSGVDFDVMRLLFFGAAVIQAVGDGIVGGIMASGRVRDGVLMSSYFALFTLLVFTFMLL